MLRRLLQQPQANEALLPALDGAVAPLDANRRDLGRLLGTAATALKPLVDQRTAVRDALAQAPSSLAAADSGLGRSRTLLRAARSLAREASLTHRATALLKTADPSIPALLKITSGAAPLLTPLHELFSDATAIINGIAPYGCDIENFGAVFRSMTGLGGYGDGPNGPAMGFRLQAVSPLPGEVLGMKDGTGLMHRDGYTRPCKFLSGPYNAVNRAGLLGSKGR
jgi:hypothetical protein